MRTDFMASAKQIKARKIFAMRSKRGDFRKGQKAKLKTQTAKAKRELTKASNKGYYPKVKGYQVCTKCLKNKVGSRQAWFQDFTGQKRICNACIDKMRKENKS
tara:strand:+ start:419 stop:727 length:309 start_codon:yes stop_codon:yes gene_type:complete